MGGVERVVQRKKKTKKKKKERKKWWNMHLCLRSISEPTKKWLSVCVCGLRRKWEWLCGGDERRNGCWFVTLTDIHEYDDDHDYEQVVVVDACEGKYVGSL